MNCIKCGKEIKEPQVFCDTCLAEMEKYPVKANVSISIPARPADTPKKKARRQKYITPEDQIRQLKFRSKLLTIMLITVLLSFIFVSVLLIHVINTHNDEYAPGQNYGTMAVTDES